MNIPTTPKNVRWWLAGWLCRFACWLRKEEWRVADTWHGVPGNRANELRQQIWVEVVTSNLRDDQQALDSIDRNLAELAQAAGEAWGHIWPKE